MNLTALVLGSLYSSLRFVRAGLMLTLPVQGDLPLFSERAGLMHNVFRVLALLSLCARCSTLQLQWLL